MSRKGTIAGYLPLKPRVLLMLTGLASTPQHGYALMTRVREMDPAVRRVGPATFYRTLDDLSERGLIQPASGRASDPRRGHTFELSRLGRDVLRAELERLDAVASEARAALGAIG
jgi:DNA-binding PadR family transcriptional regulator